MTITEFPSLDLADEDGLLAIGGDLDPESLLLAYRSAIFPWPLNQKILAWFSPPDRAILFLDKFHLSKSLEKELRRGRFTLSIDRDFPSVIRMCASSRNRKRQRGTWLTDGMVEAYTTLHKLGYAHSVECYSEEELVGGLYGVSIHGLFAGESMFYLKPNASKLCMAFLVEHLKLRGFSWIDCQVMNPHLAKMGAEIISREKYLGLLKDALASKSAFA